MERDPYWGPLEGHGFLAWCLGVFLIMAVPTAVVLAWRTFDHFWVGLAVGAIIVALVVANARSKEKP